jgi:hypothetical protein
MRAGRRVNRTERSRLDRPAALMKTAALFIVLGFVRAGRPAEEEAPPEPRSKPPATAPGKTPDGKTPDGKTPDGKTPDGKTPDGKPADAKPADGKPVQKHPPAPETRKPPQKVKLPGAGEHLARDILPLAGRLFGRKVAAEGSRVEETRLTILPEMAGRQVNREEMTVFLAAHGIYLFPHDADEGPVLVVTRNRNWQSKKEPPRFTRSFQIHSKEFEAIQKEVESYLAEKNRTAPPGLPPAGAAIDPRTRRIFVRAPSERIIAGVEEIITRMDRAETGSPHLYSFSASNRRADDLREEVLAALSEGESKRVSLLVPGRGNVILIRAPEELYQKVKSLLEAGDRPQKPKVRSSE